MLQLYFQSAVDAEYLVMLIGGGSNVTQRNVPSCTAYSAAVLVGFNIELHQDSRRIDIDVLSRNQSAVGVAFNTSHGATVRVNFNSVVFAVAGDGVQG